MLKKVIFALTPLALLVAVSSVRADDLDLDLNSISDASVEIEEASLDIDVDALANETETSADEAIEACFRGYYGGFGYGHYNCYRPFYHNYCYRPCHFYTYRTVHVYRPVYFYNNWWGCY